MSGAVLIMAGGTGGHVVPALAVARALREASCEVVWLGTRRGIEARLVAEAGFPLEWVSVSGLRGKRWTAWLIAPFRILRAIAQSLSVMRRRKPAVVLGMGGFVSGPGGAAAWLTGRPLLIHEQNAVAGLSNRLLARLAHSVFEGFAGSFPARARARHIGNPVRADIAALPGPEKRLAGRGSPLRLLVVGGSQGALALNENVPAALALLSQDRRPVVWHQTGPRTLAQAEDAYRNAGVTARLDAYIDDMCAAYAWADLVVCRAGALTIAELAAAGCAAILVPYPWSVDDHQTRNARWLSDAGAAILLPQPELDPPRLARELDSLSVARDSLLVMAQRARALALPEATGILARACLAAAEASS